MELRSLSLTQRLFAGAGCVVILVLFAAAVLLFSWERRADRAAERELVNAPVGWADSLRAAGRLPDIAEFVLPRADSVDGAWIVYDSSAAFRRAGIDHAYRAIVGSETANAADSAVWRELATDTTLDRWAVAARATRWEATRRLLASRPADAPPNLMLLPIPPYVPTRDAARALVIRGLMRLQRNDRAGARADLAAATGLGAQLVRREPHYVGMLVGRAVMASGLTGWRRYAGATRDSAMAERALRVRAWATTRPGMNAGPLMAAPDTAIAIASDTTLTLATRTLALEQILYAWLTRPRGLILGPPAGVIRALDSLTTDPDPDLAAMAGVAAGTARRLNLFGLRGLMREGQ